MTNYNHTVLIVADKNPHFTDYWSKMRFKGFYVAVDVVNCVDVDTSILVAMNIAIVVAMTMTMTMTVMIAMTITTAMTTLVTMVVT